MERFIKEYANYIKVKREKFFKAYNENVGTSLDYNGLIEFEDRIDKLLRLRERDLISTDETMAELTKMACPWLVR